MLLLSFCANQSGLQQIDFAATVHLTADELEARDLTFTLSLDQGKVIAARTVASSFDAAGGRGDEAAVGAFDPWDEAPPRSRDGSSGGIGR